MKAYAQYEQLLVLSLFAFSEDVGVERERERERAVEVEAAIVAGWSRDAYRAAAVAIIRDFDWIASRDAVFGVFRPPPMMLLLLLAVQCRRSVNDCLCARRLSWSHHSFN